MTYEELIKHVTDLGFHQFSIGVHRTNNWTWTAFHRAARGEEYCESWEPGSFASTAEFFDHVADVLGAIATGLRAEKMYERPLTQYDVEAAVEQLGQLPRLTHITLPDGDEGPSDP